MAILKKEDLLNSLKDKLTSADEDLVLLENITDTLTDLETKSNGNEAEEWKKKYEESEKTWRERYHSRFFEPSTVKEADKEAEALPSKEVPKEQQITIDDLFE